MPVKESMAIRRSSSPWCQPSSVEIRVCETASPEPSKTAITVRSSPEGSGAVADSTNASHWDPDPGAGGTNGSRATI